MKDDNTRFFYLAAALLLGAYFLDTLSLENYLRFANHILAVDDAFRPKNDVSRRRN